MSNTRKFSRWPMPLVLGGSLVCLGLGYVAARWSAPAPKTQPAEVSAPVLTTKDAPTELAAVARPAPSWDERWREKKARPVCPASTRDRAKLLEELARTDPQRALKIALAEPNWLVRDQLRDAALRGWAAVKPDDAAEWAMSQTVLG